MILTGEVTREPYPDPSVADDTEQSMYVDVMVYPQGFVLRRVQLPRTISHYNQPEKGSMILLFKQDDFTSKMITILKDPAEFLNNNPLRGEGTSGDVNFRAGEIQYESRGKASLYLNNNGTAKVSDGSQNQQFVADANNLTAYVKGINVILTNENNVFITLSKDGSTLIQSVTDPQTMVELAQIKVDSAGKITIKSTGSDVDIESVAGNVTIKAAQNIILNSGQVGAARLGDEVQVTIPPGTTLGSNTGGPLITSAPIVVKGTVTKASDTVKAG